MPVTRRPYLTYAIIAACVLVWLTERASLPFYYDVVLYRPLVAHEPWRIITSGFAHDRTQITHILFNMLSLYYLGSFLEERLGMMRYGMTYLASVLGGAFAFILLNPDGVMVGASGGVFGLMCAAIIVGLREHREVGGLVGLLAINSLLSFMSPQIAWQGHLGGAIAGSAVGLALSGRSETHTPNVSDRR